MASLSYVALIIVLARAGPVEEQVGGIEVGQSRAVAGAGVKAGSGAGGRAGARAEAEAGAGAGAEA